MTTKTARTAVDAFIARKADIDEMIERIQQMSDDHFGVNPDDVNWGHVGDLGRIVELLKEVVVASE